jgi:hypothetical protein
MQSNAATVKAYLDSLPDDRRAALAKVRAVIRKNLPAGFAESMQFGMIGYGVPLSRYPDTYNGAPLCLAALASQKNFMTLYLMSVYGDPATERWFKDAYAKSGKKLDMGKSCVHFKRVEDLPIEVIGEAIARTSVDEFIARYEASRRGKKAATKRRA